ncbi:MAG: phage tail protein [Gaiellaceae bacterium]
MAELTFAESYRTHGFRVEIGDRSCQATKVTGLNEGHTDVIEMASGGDAIVRKISSGIVKFDNLVVERDMDGTSDDAFFQAWFAEMFQLTGASRGSSVRRNGAVVKLENGHEVLRFGFVEGFVVSSKFADLEAKSTNLFKQTVEIAHNGLHRL